MAEKRNKFVIYGYLALIIGGFVIACAPIIPNQYVTLIIVLSLFCAGLYGVMKYLSNPDKQKDK